MASPLVGDLDAAFGSGFLGPFVRKSRWVREKKFSYISNVQQWRIRHLVASGLTDMGAPENSLKWSEQPAFKIWANAESRHTFFDLPPRAVLHPRRQGPGRGLDEKKIFIKLTAALVKPVKLMLCWATTGWSEVGSGSGRECASASAIPRSPSSAPPVTIVS